MLKPASCWSANSGTQSSYLIRFLLLPMIRSVLSNMYEMEQSLAKTQDINWTVVRPPGLKNLPATGERGAAELLKALKGVSDHIHLCSSGVSDPRGILCARKQQPAPPQCRREGRRGALHVVSAEQQRLGEEGSRHHHQMKR